MAARRRSETNVQVQVRWGVKVPMRDGIYLNSTVYLPVDRAEPTPVIFTSTPYIGQTYHDQAMYFASNGFPFAAVDVRGRGNSQGEFHPRGEGKDGHDVVEWFAQQPYCNGKVAMWGGSYSGFVQWATAKERPAHLAAIAPVASPYRGVDSPLRNNMFVPYTMQWMTLISGRALQDKIVLQDGSFWSMQFRRWFEAGIPFRCLDEFIGNPSPLFQEWISHPQQDDYWDSYNPSRLDYGKLSIPILTITGAYDANQAGALMHYIQYMSSADTERRLRHHLVIGPWDHSGTRTPSSQFGGLKVGPESLVDLRRLHLDWYNWVLRDGERPKFLKKHVAYYVTGADRWRYSETLDAVSTELRALYLHSTRNPVDVFSSGLLATERASGTEPDFYVYDPRDVSSAALEATVDPNSLVDQRMIFALTGKQLIYHSTVFEEKTQLSGFFKAALWISIDQPDTDFRVAVYEVLVDGNCILLATDCIRARYRASLRSASLIDTRDVLRYDFERFTFVSREIGTGSRLRLVVGPMNSIYAEKNYNAGGEVANESVNDARTVTVRLFHDHRYPSALWVPLSKVDSECLGGMSE